MQKTILIIVLIFTLSIQAQNNFTAKWDNGFKVQSEDKQFSLKFGGRIYYDAAVFFQDSISEFTFGKLNNGQEFRSARLYHSGSIYNNVKYKFNIDFASGKITFKDVFIEYTKIPVIGNIRIGHYFTPIGLEANTSSKYISFMEGAMLNKFSPSRNTGIMMFNTFLDKKINAQLGFFRYSDKFGNDKKANEGIRLQAKVSSALINNKESKTVLHLGASYEYAHSKDSLLSISVSPESHLANKVIDYKVNKIEHTDLINVEGYFAKGAFSLQSEASIMNVHSYNGGNRQLVGYYAFASYLLTGETRSYKGMNGFGRIKPKKNVGKGGFGAVEILIRHSSLVPANTNVGSRTNTFGINWYLNPSARIMFNYINSCTLSRSNTHILQTRFQIDF